MLRLRSCLGLGWLTWVSRLWLKLFRGRKEHFSLIPCTLWFMWHVAQCSYSHKQPEPWSHLWTTCGRGFSQLALTAPSFFQPCLWAVTGGDCVDHQPEDGERLLWSSGACKSLTVPVYSKKFINVSHQQYVWFSMCNVQFYFHLQFSVTISLCFSFVNSIVWSLLWNMGILSKLFILPTVFPSMAEFEVHALTRVCSVRELFSGYKFQSI